MLQKIGQITLLVRDYDEAIAYYVEVLGLELRTDVKLAGGARWVSVAPVRQNAPVLVLSRAGVGFGDQARGQTLLVLETDDCRGDYECLRGRGVNFLSGPADVPWGTQAVFEDLYGNRLELLQRSF